MKSIRAIILEPCKDARVEVIDASLKGLQTLVGGNIQVLYPFEDTVAVICNECGKLDKLPLNRGLRDSEGNLYDIIAGTAVIVSLNEDDFVSLNDAQVQRYYSMFELPEAFFQHGPRLLSFPLLPLIFEL